jgi:hypothetical protein
VGKAVKEAVLLGHGCHSFNYSGIRFSQVFVLLKSQLKNLITTFEIQLNAPFVFLQ